MKELRAKSLFIRAVNGANNIDMRKSYFIGKILTKFDLDLAVVDLTDSGIADYEKYAPTIFYQMFILKTGKPEDIKASLKKHLYRPSNRRATKDWFRMERHGLLIP